LITARFALEQNREVFAVPGSPLDPRATGSNNLLKQGARMVTDVSDVVEALRPMLADLPAPASRPLAAQTAREPDVEPLDNDRDRVLEALGPTPIEVDEIVRFTGLPVRTVQVGCRCASWRSRYRFESGPSADIGSLASRHASAITMSISRARKGNSLAAAIRASRVASRAIISAISDLGRWSAPPCDTSVVIGFPHPCPGLT
jgi:hypothetical protein